MEYSAFDRAFLVANGMTIKDTITGVDIEQEDYTWIDDHIDMFHYTQDKLLKKYYEEEKAYSRLTIRIENGVKIAGENKGKPLSEAQKSDLRWKIKLCETWMKKIAVRIHL